MFNESPNCFPLFSILVNLSLYEPHFIYPTVSNLYVHKDVHSPGRKEEGLVRYQQRHSFFRHRRYFAWINYIPLHLFTLVILCQLALFIDCFLSFICQTYFSDDFNAINCFIRIMMMMTDNNTFIMVQWYSEIVIF